ncbi:hypothetical protein DEU56DRAFT_413152 [Suillus clintonianus]|uniref:uncharacterized protein n=1 Tax=Suillus clintonianus TaxID=1904413 RepID=UPI001B8741F5|nr:uncharacterized protein DEU56DRAFT_413152 [Suillus clintonianus]KAG2134125.1 hypothetical protein DEU56DRAFT_413152 [Suillus clintonianus]
MPSHGEFLRTFKISVRELPDHSEKSHRQYSEENDAAVLCPLTTATSSDVDVLILRTDAGYCLLARYRRTQNGSDLDQSIIHFERASDLCPMDHPYHPAALFNQATAKFVSCQANVIYLVLDIPVALFQDALDLRPTGDPDRPITQLLSLLCCLASRNGDFKRMLKSRSGRTLVVNTPEYLTFQTDSRPRLPR